VKHQENNTKPLKRLPYVPLLIRLAIFIGRVLPRTWGLRLAVVIGSILGSLKNNKMVRAIRANQYVVHNQRMSDKELDEAPKIIFRSAAQCMFDYFHFLRRPEKLQKIVNFDQHAQAAINRIQNQQPTVVVCPHLSNFDLMGYALALHQVKVQVLSFPNPNATYRVQNRLRQDAGLDITPMSLTTFRDARHRLRDGGSILTGLDRPLDNVQEEKYRPRFFGFPTNLPVAYVRMALEANAPVVILAATSQSDGTYRLVGSPPIWMEPNEDLAIEILTNAEKVLRLAEPMIVNHARQWAMFYPIWPSFLGV
jgi:lauroyl/myristoyl acyltransferase